ncbi:Uncharacterised protein [Rothia dentocariosa]|nr:Uncharacterised protein [Rothia dentocariosa]
MLPVPHECPNQQTPQQNFQNYKTTPKNMTSIRSKNIYGINPAHQHPTKKKGVPVHCHNIPFHQYTSSQHNTQLCLKRIEQSTLLSSQTTHHTNNNTPSESSSVGQGYRHSILSDNLYNYTRFQKETQAKTLCFISHNLEIHSSHHTLEIVSQM